MRRILPRLGTAAGAAVLACALSLAATGASQAADPITGLWEHRDDDGRIDALIDLSEAGGGIEGRIRQIFPAPGEPANPVCSKCPGARKNAPVVGLQILGGLRRAEGGYAGGRILDPKSGTEYQLSAELSQDGRTLKLRGFVGVSLLGRTQVWTRRS